MSSIASAFKTTEQELSRVLQSIAKKDYASLREFRNACEIGTLPYSGYVLAAVIPFLAERGIQLPCGERIASLSDAARKQMRIVVCGRLADFESVADRISGLQATDDELRNYYKNLYEHDWDEAANAMRDGIAFIDRGIRALNSDEELLVFTIA